VATFESFGKYALLEKLATGGMAEVFLARGIGAGGIGKFFAIKRILPQYADSPEFIDMFKDEAKIAINLSHNNIVSIHEFGVEKGQFFIVMDYVEGRNLRQILNKMKKSGLQFSIDQIIYIFKEVAAGLDHAHRCIDGSTGKPLNITHRDMSPQNVMLSFEGEVKIVDFGIAKAESQLETTRAGTLKGKFGYMSPEQAEGQPVDLRTDIFSLGIVLWELLANDRLFVANNEINTLRKIRDCQIPSLRKVNPNIHTELERIVQKALARDRNLRYQTGAAMHRDLNRFLNRQYPDFSSQDFAVFIKSVFADEILSLRKRLVEYARFNPAAGATPVNTKRRNQDAEEHTSVVDTSTSSMVANETQITHSEVTDSVSAAAVEPQTPSPVKANNTESSTTDSLEVADAVMPPRGSAMGLVLDEQALADMGKTKDSMPTLTQKTKSYASRAESRMRSRSGSRSGPMRAATFLVFCLLTVSVYAYLVKYFTPMMNQVITATDPYLHAFHAALGVEVNSTVNSSNSSAPPPETQEPIAATPAPAIVTPPHVEPAPEPVPAPTPVPATPPVSTTEDTGPAFTMVTVTSNPSGATIFLDEKNTGMVTPSRVEVPARKTFSLSLRKRGYAEYRLRNTTKEETGQRVTVKLLKQNVAYLDIDVFPPVDVVISINGKVTGLKPPLHDVEIPANIPVKIRAEHRGGGVDEMTVNLPNNRRQSIQLSPRKGARVPSNQDH